MNAIRINQADAINLVRQQLQHLSAIEQYTSYLISIDNRLKKMDSENWWRDMGVGD